MFAMQEWKDSGENICCTSIDGGGMTYKSQIFGKNIIL